MNASTVSPTNVSEVEGFQTEMRNRIIGTLGVFLNIIAVLALWLSRHIRPSVKLALMSMSLTDLILMVVAAAWSPNLPCWSGIYIVCSSVLVSYFMTILLAIHNFIAVFYPTRCQQILTVSNCLKSVALSWLLGYLISLGCIGFEVNVPSGFACYIVAFMPRGGLVVVSSVCLLCSICIISINLLVLIKLRQKEKKYNPKSSALTIRNENCHSTTVARGGDETRHGVNGTQNSVAPRSPPSKHSCIANKASLSSIPPVTDRRLNVFCTRPDSNRTIKHTRHDLRKKQKITVEESREGAETEQIQEIDSLETSCTSRIHFLPVPHVNVFSKSSNRHVESQIKKCALRIPERDLPQVEMISYQHNLPVNDTSVVTSCELLGLDVNIQLTSLTNVFCENKKVENGNTLITNDEETKIYIQDQGYDTSIEMDIVRRRINLSLKNVHFKQQWSHEESECSDFHTLEKTSATEVTSCQPDIVLTNRKRDQQSLNKDTLYQSNDIFDSIQADSNKDAKDITCSSSAVSKSACTPDGKVGQHDRYDSQTCSSIELQGGKNLKPANRTYCSIEIKGVQNEDTSADPPVVTADRSNSTDNTTQAVSETTNGTQTKRKSWRKRTQTTLLILCSWCCFLTLPYIIYGTYVATTVEDRVGFTSSGFGILISSLAVLNSLTNPLLYAWRFIEWRDAWKTLCGKVRKCVAW